MSITDMIPTLDDAALANLRTNASRLEATGVGPRQKEAALLLPLIDAELATRKANGVKTIRAVRATKATTKTAAPQKGRKFASAASSSVGIMSVILIPSFLWMGRTVAEKAMSQRFKRQPFISSGLFDLVLRHGKKLSFTPGGGGRRDGEADRRLTALSLPERWSRWSS